MTDQQLTPDELYEQYFPGHVVAFDAEHEAEYAQIFSGEAHGQESEPASPEPTPEATDDETREAKVERAVFQSAAAANGDPASLLDSSAFLASVKDLDPDDVAAITAAIDTAVKSNPRLAAPSRLPRPNPAQGSSGSGPVYDVADLEYSKFFPTNERL